LLVSNINRLDWWRYLLAWSSALHWVARAWLSSWNRPLAKQMHLMSVKAQPVAWRSPRAAVSYEND
jgi:hypothetical protein